MKNLANNIRKIRVLRDMTQQEVSKQLGMTQGNYARLEKGDIKISIDRLQRISEILNCSSNKIQHFNPDIFFNQNSPEIDSYDSIGSNNQNRMYVSPEWKQMYDERIKYLESYAHSLKDEINFLKTK